MNVYVYPIATAVAVFPLLSAVFTLPYVMNQYHKYGALLVLRIILVYSFIFYLMTSYFMTILPLPPIDSVKDGGTTMLLVPFHALKLWWVNCGFIYNDPSTYLPAIMNYDFLQMAFNILLLLPFGVYLRYYFERKWYQVLLMSFAYSLFFELTQLSGLYGIYPHPYRWFEVDDLICNTLGGMLGFVITPLCSFFLPSRDRLDEMSYHKGKRVSIIRRGLANIIDWTFISFLLFLFRTFIWNGKLKALMPFYPTNVLSVITVSFLLYYVLSSWIMSGKTLGKYVVSICIKGEENQKAKLYQYILRYAIIYIVVVPTPSYLIKLLQLFNQTKVIWIKAVTGISIAVLITIFLYTVINVFICAITHHSQTIYDRISHTQQVSVIVERTDAESEEAEKVAEPKEEVAEPKEEAKKGTQFKTEEKADKDRAEEKEKSDIENQSLEGKYEETNDGTEDDDRIENKRDVHNREKNENDNAAVTEESDVE